jgi:DNA-binding transcriptional LysR family regulator
VELRHLRYFTAVAENGGFARAARLLNVAQSAISEQIRDLEAELGVSLFDRTNRRVVLTEHGNRFLEDARVVLSAAAKASANIQRSLRGEIGTLTVGFFVGGTGTFFPAIIREFRSRFPDAQITLVEMAPGMQHAALQSGAIDIGFTRTLQPAETAALRSEHFLTEPMCAVLLKSHRLAKRRAIPVRELANERFVLNDRRYSPAAFDKVITLCAEAGFSPRIGTTATVSSGVIALVEAGEGVAVLPKGANVLISEELVFVPLADRGASIDLVLAWVAEHESPVLHAFLELARRRRKSSLARHRADE